MTGSPAVFSLPVGDETYLMSWLTDPSRADSTPQLADPGGRHRDSEAGRRHPHVHGQSVRLQRFATYWESVMGSLPRASDGHRWYGEPLLDVFEKATEPQPRGWEVLNESWFARHFGTWTGPRRSTWSMRVQACRRRTRGSLPSQRAGGPQGSSPSGNHTRKEGGRT